MYIGYSGILDGILSRWTLHFDIRWLTNTVRTSLRWFETLTKVDFKVHMINSFTYKYILMFSFLHRFWLECVVDAQY